MTAFFRNNGLTIALMLLFLGSIIGQWLTGWRFQNEDLARHGEPTLTLFQYAADPQFVATVFENWESEFLQMSAYVLLTCFLFQKGSAESNDPEGRPRDVDLAGQGGKRGAPAILGAGAAARWLYANSLGLTLLILFIASFLMHWAYSAREAAAAAVSHGDTPLTRGQYLWSAQLWFESFQNWQSEFLSTAVLVVLTIFLRQRESPESKAVAAPHGQTGT
jgi:glycerol uptake facilitator-like aquaporin